MASKTNDVNNKEAVPVSVKLLRPHTHAGKDYQEGDTVNVCKADAEWLVSNGIGERP